MNEIGTLKLETERLVLRRLEKNDAKELFEGFINQKEFLYYTNKLKLKGNPKINAMAKNNIS